MEASFVTSPTSAPTDTSCSAFERFFRENYPAVVRIACGVVGGDPQAAQDVAQDVFIAAMRRFPDPGAVAARASLGPGSGCAHRAERDPPASAVAVIASSSAVLT